MKSQGQKGLKKQIKNINFSLMLDTIQDDDIIFKKYTGLVANIGIFLRNLALLYNDTKGDKRLYPIRGYIENCKASLAPFKEETTALKQRMTIPTEEENKVVLASFKRFSASPLIDIMMFSVHSFEGKKELISENNEWIISSPVTNNPFKDCDISLYQLYMANKASLNAYLPGMYNAISSFYELYVAPNFDLERSVDNICSVLEELHRRKDVSCKSVPKYIRQIANGNFLDMKELNLQYLQTEDPNTFIVYLLKQFMSPHEEFSVDTKLAGEIKALFTYIQKKVDDPAMASTLTAGFSMIKMNNEAAGGGDC